MEVESFESEEIAKLMNDWFVNIKVSSTFVTLFVLWRPKLVLIICSEVDGS